LLFAFSEHVSLAHVFYLTHPHLELNPPAHASYANSSYAHSPARHSTYDEGKVLTLEDMQYDLYTPYIYSFIDNQISVTARNPLPRRH
jgi:hypothetical protein